MALPSPSTDLCDALLAKLDEVMSFLRFAKLADSEFRGVVTFYFRASNASACTNADPDAVACIRTVDMRRGVEVLMRPLAASDSFLPEVAPIHVSLADFLFMYSGEATASEIAGMCISGRVSVPWSAYGKLKAFAECFDFSSEKWEQYYAVQAATGTGIATAVPCCTKACCQSTTKEEIDANWCLVSDASTKTVHNRRVDGQVEEWEVVSDCSCLVLTKEKREQLLQVDDWFYRFCQGDPVQKVQANVKNSFNDLVTLLLS